VGEPTHPINWAPAGKVPQMIGVIKWLSNR